MPSARRTTPLRQKVKATKALQPRPQSEADEPSSGNVFADLGFRNAEDRLLKAELATKLVQLIGAKSWTQVQTAQRTALGQPKVSRLMRGQLSGFSVDRLLAVLNRLGHSVEVRISAKERAPKEESYTRVIFI